MLTLNPARCSLKAIRSRNDTNWELRVSYMSRQSRSAYKTSDLVVQSLFRSFSSSSTKASSLELDLQFYASAPADHRKYAQLTSRFKRDKIPCLALPTRLSACSSMSTASASRSIEISM